MAPLPLPDPEAKGALGRFLSSISSLFKSKPSRCPGPDGDESTPIMDWEVPSIPITPLTPSQLPAPAGSELKPSELKKEDWLEIAVSESKDEHEAVSNWLGYNHKRSLEAQEPLVMARDRAGIETQVEQRLQGESCQCLSHSQEVALMIFIFIFMVLMRFVIMSAIIKIMRRVHCRVARWVEEIGEGQRMYTVLYWIGYCGLIVGLGVIFHLGTSYLDKLLQVAIMGA